MHIVPQTIYNIYISETDRKQLLAEAENLVEEHGVQFDYLPAFSALLGTLQYQDAESGGANIGTEIGVALSFDEPGEGDDPVAD